MPIAIPDVSAALIQNFETVPDKPIFKLGIGSRSFNVVVKGFNAPRDADDTRTSIRWSSKLMKHANNHLTVVKTMSHAEKGSFKAYVSGLRGTIDDKIYTKAMAWLNDSQIIWLKMPFVHGLWDYDFWPRGHDIDLSVLAHGIALLHEPGAWKAIGEIVAADLVNGNSDRYAFMLDDDALRTRLQNPGNLMFQTTAAGTRPIGLDTFDGDLHNPHRMLTTHPGDSRLLTMVNDPASRRLMAGQIVAATVQEPLARCLKRKKVKAIDVMLVDERKEPKGFLSLDADSALAHFQTLGAVDEVDAGLKEGLDRLRSYLQGKARKHNQFGADNTIIGPSHAKHIPTGIVARMHTLGWDSPTFAHTPTRPAGTTPRNLLAGQRGTGT